MKLDNVFADDQAHSTWLVKDAAIILGDKRGNMEPSGDDVTVKQTPGSSAGTPLSCDARFVPFPALLIAPEMAGTVPPEDKTLYVAADGTGDFYSIQRALDAAPKEGALVLVAPGTYREVLTIDKPNIQLRSANRDASKTIIVNDRSAGAQWRHAALRYGECDRAITSLPRTSPSRTTSTPPIRSFPRARRLWR